MQNIQVVQPGETRKRFHRRPNFPIAGTMKPFGLYPIMCHPILPGETLKAAKTKWSVISMPLKNPTAGAWLESWLFYVKLTDLDRDLGNMFIADDYSTTGYVASGNNEKLFTANGQIDWIKLCLERIRDAYFLNEGETPLSLGAPETNIPKVKINNRSWFQNIMFEPAEVALNTTGERDHVEQMNAYQMLTQMQMTELTYEAYLEQYGVQSARIGRGDPEILRYNRSWTKPVNHIDPSNGTPSSAWVWNDEMTADKDKRFQEPGFLIQCAAIRPKMYNALQLYSMVGELWGFTDWYPAYNLTDPTAGVRRIPSDTPVMDPAINAAEATVQMLYDHRDLLNHGEQFINDRTNNPYNWPFNSNHWWTAGADPAVVRGEYVGNADVDALFVEPTLETGLRAYYEGITGLTIAGHVTDTTL